MHKYLTSYIVRTCSNHIRLEQVGGFCIGIQAMMCGCPCSCSCTARYATWATGIRPPILQPNLLGKSQSPQASFKLLGSRLAWRSDSLQRRGRLNVKAVPEVAEVIDWDGSLYLHMDNLKSWNEKVMEAPACCYTIMPGHVPPEGKNVSAAHAGLLRAAQCLSMQTHDKCGLVWRDSRHRLLHRGNCSLRAVPITRLHSVMCRTVRLPSL